MLPVLKLGLLAGGLGIIALEGWGVYSLSGKREEPIPRTLEQIGVTTTQSSQKLKDKETNNKHLVADRLENFYWWNWVFEYRFLLADKSTLDNHFKYIEKGYDTAVNRVKQIGESKPQQLSLNKACAKAYEQEVTSFNDKENLKNNIKLFCTPQGNKTLTFN